MLFPFSIRVYLDDRAGRRRIEVLLTRLLLHIGLETIRYFTFNVYYSN